MAWTLAWLAAGGVGVSGALVTNLHWGPQWPQASESHFTHFCDVEVMSLVSVSILSPGVEDDTCSVLAHSTSWTWLLHLVLGQRLNCSVGRACPPHSLTPSRVANATSSPGADK